MKKDTFLSVLGTIRVIVIVMVAILGLTACTPAQKSIPPAPASKTSESATAVLATAGTGDIDSAISEPEATKESDQIQAEKQVELSTVPTNAFAKISAGG